jgi:hypothetical protein
LLKASKTAIFGGTFDDFVEERTLQTLKNELIEPKTDTGLTLALATLKQLTFA